MTPGAGSTVDALLAALSDPSETVRAEAAVELARHHDARALPVLVATIDLLPDVLMAPGTAATNALIAWGPGALPAVLPLLRAPQPQTRARGFMVLQALASMQPGAGAWGDVWRANGSYRADDPDTMRRETAADLWAAWVARQTLPP